MECDGPEVLPETLRRFLQANPNLVDRDWHVGSIEGYYFDEPTGILRLYVNNRY